MGLDGGNGDEFPREQFNFIFSYSNLWLSVYFPLASRPFPGSLADVL